jgi:hypothetical protein
MQLILLHSAIWTPAIKQATLNGVSEALSLGEYDWGVMLFILLHSPLKLKKDCSYICIRRPKLILGFIVVYMSFTFFYMLHNWYLFKLKTYNYISSLWMQINCITFNTSNQVSLFCFNTLIKGCYGDRRLNGRWYDSFSESLALKSMMSKARSNRWYFFFQWLYSTFLGPGLIFQFLNLFYTDGRTPWTSDQPVARPLPIHRTTQTQKNAQTYKHPCLE